MGKSKNKYVAKAEPGIGWFIWDRKMERNWGEVYSAFPEELLAELNGEKRQEKIIELSKKYKISLNIWLKPKK